MIWFKYGDRYASVATMQRMLNLAGRRDSRLKTGAPLEVDGIFGRLTHRRVREVQRVLEARPIDGVLGPSTWKKLRPIVKCRVVDVTDMVVERAFQKTGEAALRQRWTRGGLARGVNPAVIRAKVEKAIRRYRAEAKDCRNQHDRFVAMGGQPIPIYSAKGALDVIRRGVAARSKDGWQVIMLRFTGHGAAADQGIAATASPRGRGITMDSLTFDADDTAEELVETVMVAGMTNAMARWGSVELHGCNVAADKWTGKGRNRTRINGPAYVQKFADTTGRPTTASTVQDMSGSVRWDVRFEGGVVSCVPGGGRVKDWFATVTGPGARDA